jgi:Ca2+-binding EF-hand superfamily protein
MKRMMIASMASLVLTSGLALAHGDGKGFARWDRDGNGAVTRDEMRTTAVEQFQKIDLNKDGRLTLDEIQAAHREHAAARFAEKDANKDGKLERTEVPRMPDEMFKRLDANNDGALTPDELAAKGARFAEHAQKRFQHEDANGDGAISQDEVIAAVDKRFARMDKNGDGVLTQDELRAHHGHHKPGAENTPAR